jgi:dolichol kinase
VTTVCFAAAIPETLCGRVANGKGGPIDVDDNLAVPIGAGLLLTAFLRNLFPALI